jgi:hypothetical protein
MVETLTLLHVDSIFLFRALTPEVNSVQVTDYKCKQNRQMFVLHFPFLSAVANQAPFECEKGSITNQTHLAQF